MKPRETARKKDFLSISGSKMRAMARAGARPCSGIVPSDWEDTLSCVPKGFMVEDGWRIVVDYYRNQKSTKWIPYSRVFANPMLSQSGVSSSGTFGTANFKAQYLDNSRGVAGSFWHDIPLQAGGNTLQMVVEIPKGRMEKLEVNKEVAGNPIMQDMKKGLPRYYMYGLPFFNYGMLPQTWEGVDAVPAENNLLGDGDPLDVIEIGSTPLPIGTVISVKVLGAIKMIDQGEVDYKIIVIRQSEANSAVANTVTEDFASSSIGRNMMDWLINYKLPEGKGKNEVDNKFMSASASAEIIDHTHALWKKLTQGTLNNPGYSLPRAGSALL